MLSRVANAIYWLGRYFERAENVARFIGVNHQLMLDLSVRASEQWRPLVITTGDRADFEARYEEYSAGSVMHFLTFDRANPNSILSCMTQARENARSVREVISSEMWEQINRTYLFVTEAARSGPIPARPHEFYERVKTSSHLFQGVTDVTMSHNEAWHFARVARLTERADKTARIVDVKYFILLPKVDYVGSAYDTILWSALLRSASAFEMYRKAYRTVRPDKVAEFLVLDRQFPRAILACVLAAEYSMHTISGTPLGDYANSAERALGRLRAELAYGRMDEILASGLHEYLDDLQTRLNQVGEAIYETFFDVQPVDSASADRGRARAAAMNEGGEAG